MRRQMTKDANGRHKTASAYKRNVASEVEVEVKVSLLVRLTDRVSKYDNDDTCAI